MSDKALTTCPKDRCRQKTWGKGKVRRVIGAGAGLIFKGSGFYITDYRSDSYKEAAKKESSSAKPDAGKSEKKEKPAGSSTPAPSAPSAPAKPAKQAKPSE